MGMSGRVAVVTGGARGIGRAIVERYVRDGASAFVADRDIVVARATAADVGGLCVSVPLDVTSQESIDAMVSEVVRRAGSIDILVNNAGVFDMKPLVEVDREDFRRVFSVNVEGLFFTLQAVARQMIEQGRGGRIINLASQAGRRGEPLVSIYCASKAAVISVTQSSALALAPYRINVNAIAPGVVDTPMYDEVDALCARYMNIPVGENKRQVSAGVPYGRMGKAEEIAAMAAFLAGEDAEYVVAQTLGVDGGNWMA